ncbi:PAS domain-containing protein [Leptospira sp. 96542]|nr:PAS domain-containing protein [Leptospira sp. 96542]
MDFHKYFHFLIVTETLEFQKQVLDSLDEVDWKIKTDSVGINFDFRNSEFPWHIVIISSEAGIKNTKKIISDMRIREPEIPIILVTERLGFTVLLEYLEVGLSDYVYFDRLHQLRYQIVRETNRYLAYKDQLSNIQTLLFHQQTLTRMLHIAKLGYFEMNILTNEFHWSPEINRILGFPYIEDITLDSFLRKITECLDEDFFSTWEKLKNKETKYETLLIVRMLPTPMYAKLLIESDLALPSNPVIFGTIQDISETIQLKGAVLTSRKLFQDLFDNSSQLIILIDGKRIIKYVNPKAKLKFEDTNNPLVGKNFVEVFTKFLHSKDSAIIQKTLDMAMENHKLSFLSYLNINTETESILDCNLYRLNDPDGNFLNLVWEAKDIKNEIEMERKFSIAKKMEALGIISGSIAHDIGNLLVPMFNFIKVIEMEIENKKVVINNEKIFGYIESMNKLMLGAKNLVNGLLDKNKVDPTQNSIGITKPENL